MSNKSVIAATPWAALDAVGAAALNLFTIVLLSRILAPGDFGLVVLAQSVVLIVQLVAGLGLLDAIVQRQHLDEAHQDSAFTASSVMGAVGFLICAAIAALLDDAGYTLRLVIVVEGLACVASGIGTLPTAILTRSLQTSTLAKRTLIGRSVYLVTAILLAVTNFGLWSIVIANALQNIVATAMVWLALERKPRFRISWTHTRDLALFGAPIMLEGVLWSVLSRVFNMLVAKYHGLDVLGFLNMAMKATDALAGIVQSICSKVALPMLSKHQSDPDRLRVAFMSATEVLAFVSFPAFLGLGVTSDIWVPLFLGEQWAGAVPAIRVLSAYWTVMFSRMFVGYCLRAKGHSSAYLLPAVIAALSTVAAVLLTAGMAPIYTIYAWAGRVVITLPIGAYLLLRYAGISYQSQFRPTIGPLFCSSVMIASIYWLRSVTSLEGLSLLAASIAVGGSTYVAAAGAYYRGTALRALRSLRSSLLPGAN